jgi:hypothetical protein
VLLRQAANWFAQIQVKNWMAKAGQLHHEKQDAVTLAANAAATVRQLRNTAQRRDADAAMKATRARAFIEMK